jgi:hypothetical protein
MQVRPVSLASGNPILRIAVPISSPEVSEDYLFAQHLAKRYKQTDSSWPIFIG